MGQAKPCKYCGKEGLTWKDEDGRWVLYDGSTKHTCKRDGAGNKVEPISDLVNELFKFIDDNAAVDFDDNTNDQYEALKEKILARFGG